MRILYLFRSLAVWGGIERVLVEKMNYLASIYGYDIYMLTTDQGDHPIPYKLESDVHLEDLGIQFHHQYRFSGLKRLMVARRLKRLLKKKLSDRLRYIRPDVLVCTAANYDDINILAKVKEDNIPLIVESHSICNQTLYQKGIRKKYANYMYRKGLAKSDVVVSLTEGDAVEWRKVHPCVRVIPNMVLLNGGSLSSLKQKHVIWVGRFDYQKQPFEIIKIWQLVISKHSDWYLDIYGEGELQQELEDTIRPFSNICLHKPTDRIFDAYRESSILVSTSLFEPFGLVIPEAMSCGLPVVAYDCPFGPSSIISDGEDGFLIEKNDHQAFADKLCLLMSDNSLRQRMGKAACASVQHYSAGIIMPKWRDLFLSLLPSQ